MKKNSIQAITVGIISVLIGILFFRYGGINYNPGGVTGETSSLDLLLSIIYILLVFSVAFVAGLFNLRGIIWGLFGYCIAIIILFFIGGLGVGSIIAVLVLPMYILVAPFAPVIDTLSRLTISPYINDKAVIFIPICFYLLSLLIYYLGRKIKATKNDLF